MDSALRQRLVGAAVLIGLAVVFLPSILDGEKLQSFDEHLIPVKPHSAELARLASALSTNRVPVTGTPALPRSKSGLGVKHIAARGSSGVNTDVLSVKSPSFVVQVASFSSIKNARELVSRLRKSGFKAYVGQHPVNRHGKRLTQVFVGPALLRADAERWVKKIQQREKVKATVVEFDPLKH